MNRLFIAILFCCFTLGQEAEITNIQASQRTDGSKLVDIYFDLSEDSLFTYFEISAEVSINGGNTYEPMLYISGDVGIGIIYGENKF